MTRNTTIVCDLPLSFSLSPCLPLSLSLLFLLIPPLSPSLSLYLPLPSSLFLTPSLWLLSVLDMPGIQLFPLLPHYRVHIFTQHLQRVNIALCLKGFLVFSVLHSLAVGGICSKLIMLILHLYMYNEYVCICLLLILHAVDLL